MLKFLQQGKQVEASEAYSRASLSRNRRLPARYHRSNDDDDDEEEGEEDIDGEEEDIDEEEE